MKFTLLLTNFRVWSNSDTIHSITMIEKILALSKKLISINTTKDNNRGLKDAILVAKKSLSGLTIEEFEKNGSPSLLAYAGKKRPKSFKIILNGHLDIVPAQVGQYQPLTKDGRLVGRGAYDMKAAAAVMILVFKELAKRVSYPLGLQLVTDEETGGFSGTKYQIDQGVRADFTIAGEPTDFEINNDAKGIIWLKLSSSGKSAHGAYSWLGDNALQKLVTAVYAIYSHYPTPTKEVWQTTLNLSWIKTANTTVNKVPDEGEAMFDIRFIPGEEKRIITEIQKLLPKDVKLAVEMMEPAQFTPKDNAYLLKLQKVTSQILGKSMPIVVKHGGSDIRHYNRVRCFGVTFGPRGAGHHTETEWVDIKSLGDYQRVLTAYLKELDRNNV